MVQKIIEAIAPQMNWSNRRNDKMESNYRLADENDQALFADAVLWIADQGLLVHRHRAQN